MKSEEKVIFVLYYLQGALVQLREKQHGHDERLSKSQVKQNKTKSNILSKIGTGDTHHVCKQNVNNLLDNPFEYLRVVLEIFVERSFTL